MASWKKIITTGDDSAYKNSNLVSGDIPANAVTTAKIADDAITSSKIVANAVSASELNVSGNGTSGQFLASDADGSFSWTSPTTGDITGVTAGAGLSGGGTSGAVTLNIDANQSFGSIYSSDLELGVAANKPRIEFEFHNTDTTKQRIQFSADASEMTLELINVDAGNNIDTLQPVSDRQVNLGASGKSFNNAYIRTANIVDIVLNGTSISSTAAELNLLDGVTATTAELNYVDGVTSAIQAQFSGKASITGSSGQNFSSNDLSVHGNLTVNGTTTTINTATLNVEDKLIKLGDVSSPTTTTGHLAGIQVETSATEAEWPELKWSNAGSLTGWSISDHKGTSNEDFPVSVMKFGTSAPSGAPDSGAGTLFSDTSNNNAYIYI